MISINKEDAFEDGQQGKKKQRQAKFFFPYPEV